ncbi:DNA/RNA nuclease SfsA, partial [Candidatus Pacearchaeota archaeon]|nr:DNA/RNA nuclease SfsA [Candidatus Pacearchaeota archaeon]
IKREVTLAKSRIDFLINNRDYLEVKMPLKDINSDNHPKYKENTNKFNSFDRIIKHFKDVSNSISKDSRVIFLLCFIFKHQYFHHQ